MKTFLKYDYFIQLIILIVCIVGAVMHYKDWKFIEFYYGVGGAQLISYLIRLFFKLKQTSEFRVYGLTIMPVWICLLLVDQKIYNEFTMALIGIFLLLSLLYTPIMAILYVYDCYNSYEPYKLRL
ncbi:MULTISPECIES: hypothetical protein [Chryseobacterium]|uniref:Uncharacterized protein n=1 Tax=Chryseobacterium candidae TaxID=1978493 RepID=A0ABY2R5A2_9FLAO|nr:MULTISPECIES: hypothetical protein [Chryseobacterium]PXW16295.1 hypothetical protein C8D70_104234 [Chryseobacterium sp. CBTAP 102]THV56312.1 hypothetical protein EK417_19400 [Chryseobacterium candidae]SIQ51611.1 hypothetical protein SAMN05880573_10687 [Chryseobacterium sp. RU33C]